MQVHRLQERCAATSNRNFEGRQATSQNTCLFVAVRSHASRWSGPAGSHSPHESGSCEERLELCQSIGFCSGLRSSNGCCSSGDWKAQGEVKRTGFNGICFFNASQTSLHVLQVLERRRMSGSSCQKCRSAAKCGIGPLPECRYKYCISGSSSPTDLATAQYERCGTSASAHPDPDPDPELLIKSLNSVPDPSVLDHQMQYLKSQ